jgi:hypothetical protein
MLGDSIAELTLEPLQAGTRVRINELPTGMLIGMTTVPVLGALDESKYAASLMRLERYTNRRSAGAKRTPERSSACRHA